MLTRSLRLLPALLATIFLTAAAAAQDSDRWYLVKMMNQPCGDLHSVVRTEGDRVITSNAMKISLKRGEAVLMTIAVESEFVETKDGRPISMKSVQNMGGQPATSTYTFKEDGSVELVSQQGGQPIAKTLPKPEGVWLPPHASDKYIRQRLKAGAEEITVRTIDPTSGIDPVTVKYTGFEKTSVVVEGRTIDAIKRSITTNAGGAVVKSTDYVDSECELIRSRMDLGGISLDIIATDKEGAKKTGDAPEIMVSTFATPDKPIDNPRRTSKVVLHLSVPEEMPALPNTSSQRVERTKDGARVTITGEAIHPAPEQDMNDPALLAATTMANINDDEIKKLAQRAVEGADDSPQAKAEACRRFVHKYIKKKNLGTAFASASEVARSREGDCTEHGVLLTALLRAHGIPSRAVVGLIYADQFAGAERIFGYHMWSQALLTVDGQPRWIDLDPTLPDKHPFDATHITLDTSKLADGTPVAGLGAIASMLGRLTIKVESVEHAPALTNTSK